MRGLRDCVAGLLYAANTEADDDGVAIDLGGRYVGVDCINERRTNEQENTSHDIPRYVVAKLG